MQPTDFASVTEFGAKGDGVADDSAAFQAAFDAKTCVFVPAGVYCLGSGVRIQNKSFLLQGAGPAVTELRFGTVNVGIDFDSSDSVSVLTIRDMSITTTNVLGGTALDLRWPESFEGRNDSRGLIENVQVRGANEETQGWANGIRYTQAINVHVLCCGLCGRDTGGTGDLSQAAKTASRHGIQFKGGLYPVELKITDSVVNKWDKGIDITGAPEGISIHGSTIAECRLGLNVDVTTFSAGIGGGSAKFRPLLSVSDSHFACYQTCIISDGMIQSFIHDNLLYIGDHGSQDAEIIRLHNAGDVQVHHNSLYKFASQHGVSGIVVMDAVCVVIESNIFDKGLTRGIWFHAGARDCRYRNNVFRGPYAGGDIVDDGTSNGP